MKILFVPLVVLCEAFGESTKGTILLLLRRKSERARTYHHPLAFVFLDQLLVPEPRFDHERPRP